MGIGRALDYLAIRDYVQLNLIQVFFNFMRTKLFFDKAASVLILKKAMVSFLMKQGIVSTHENLPLKIVTNTKATIILANVLADKRKNFV